MDEPPAEIDDVDVDANTGTTDDLTLIDENIYKMSTIFKSKPTTEDIEENTDNVETGYVMSSRNEVLGWLIWDFSTGPQFQVFVALCWTVFVTTNATEYACTQYFDYGCDIYNNGILTDKEVQIRFGGMYLKPESFYFLVVSCSGAIQLIAYVTVGGLMDYGTYQYHLFRVCTIVAALFDAPYIFLSDPSSFYFAGPWTAIGVVFWGIAQIAYLSALVDIVENHWLVRRAQRMGFNANARYELRQLIVNGVSSYGVSMSYTASLLMTMVAAVIFVLMAETRWIVLESYGEVHDNGIEEMFAKNVFGANIVYTDPKDNLLLPQVVSIQLLYIYDDVPFNGSYIGQPIADANINDDYIYKTETFYTPTHPIRKVNLWYNAPHDESIAAIQFENTLGDESAIFGNVSSAASAVVESEEDGFVLGGYTVYTLHKAGVGMQVVCGFDFVFVSLDGQYKSTLALRVVVFCVFVFWMGFQMITICTMKKRVKPAIPATSSVWCISAQNTWKTLTQTFAKYEHIRNALIAWFFYSDAIGTVMISSILFAQIELHFSFVELIVMLLEFEIFCAVGGVFHVWMQKKLGWDCRQMMIYHLSLYSVYMSYIILGAIPGVPFGLKAKWEMWVVIFFFGMHSASQLGYGRALMSSLIPIGKENEMFSLYAVTDKGSSWIGPLVMGTLSNSIGLRLPLLYVLSFFLISIPIVYSIDIKEGMIQAGRLDADGKEKQVEMQSKASHDKEDEAEQRTSIDNSTDEAMAIASASD
eukprot:484231_1